MNSIKNQIEIFVRSSDRLSIENKKEVRSIIKSDPEAAAYFKWFKSFYRVYENLNKKSRQTADEDSTIKLVPMEQEIDSKRTMFVLAAQSTETNGALIETVRTFVSEEHRMLLRAIHYRNRKEIRIHILSEQIDEEDIILFDVPEQNLFLVTRPGGKLSADTAEIRPDDVRNWKTCNVHLPVCKVKEFGAKSESSSYLAGKSVFSETIVPIEANTKGDTVELYPILEESKPLCNHLVIYSKNQSTIIDMYNGTASVPKQLIQGEEVRLYFYN